MDVCENLQIKREISPPTTPENISPIHIKAKLNQYVKRRLRDCNEPNPENVSINNTNSSIAIVDIKKEPQKSEAVRQKRPYLKRADKLKPAQCSEKSLLASNTIKGNITSQRKYKPKIKQSVVNESQKKPCINATEENSGFNHNSTITAGTISAGDEDETNHDNEPKSAREKEKCPDILSMVLSMKKRSLMQDPEVQRILKEIINVIKN